MNASNLASLRLISFIKRVSFYLNSLCVGILHFFFFFPSYLFISNTFSRKFGGIFSLYQYEEQVTSFEIVLRNPNYCVRHLTSSEKRLVIKSFDSFTPLLILYLHIWQINYEMCLKLLIFQPNSLAHWENVPFAKSFFFFFFFFYKRTK